VTALLEVEDLADVRLCVTVDRAGEIEIQHQASDDPAWTERQLALLAARIDEKVQPESGRVVLPRRARGVTVMPCARCGVMLDAGQLHWLTPWTGSPLIRQVGCRTCAGKK
jgi:hypothetical protein